MAEYYPLLAKAVANLKDSTPDTRRAIYERARKALLAQLNNMQPPIATEDVAREESALDLAIARLEADVCAPASAAEPPASPPEAPAVLAPAKVETPPAPRPAAPAAGSVAPLPPPPTPRPPAPRPAGGAAWPPPVPRVAGDEARPLRPAIPPAPPRPASPPAPPVSPAPTTESASLRAPPPPPVALAAEDSAAGNLDRLRAFGRSRVEDGQPPLSEPRSEPAPVEPPRGEAFRPLAPRAAHETSVNKRAIGIFVGVVAVLMVAIAGMAYKWRETPQDFARPKPAATNEQPEPAPNKLSGRAGEKSVAAAPTQPAPVAPAPQPAAPAAQPAASPTPVAPSPAAPSVPIAQRGALLIDAPDEPTKVKTYVGTVLWSLDTTGALPVLKAQLDIPEARYSVAISIAKNVDPAFAASHKMEVRFTAPPDGPVPGVKQIAAPEMRGEDRPQGDGLTGLPARVTDNYFWVALAQGDTITQRNLDLMRDRGWLDIPMLLNNDKIAKITLEKGVSGDQAMRQAFAAWGQ